MLDVQNSSLRMLQLFLYTVLWSYLLYVQAMFVGNCPPVQSVSFVNNGFWYVVFPNGDDAYTAYLWVLLLASTFTYLIWVESRCWYCIITMFSIFICYVNLCINFLMLYSSAYVDSFLALNSRPRNSIGHLSRNYHVFILYNVLCFRSSYHVLYPFCHIFWECENQNNEFASGKFLQCN